MNPDDNVCLCYRVSLGKLRSYLEREDPSVASLLSECLGAGTGCGWCVPYLEELHARHTRGEPVDLTVGSEAYAQGRVTYKKTGDRPESTDG